MNSLPEEIQDMILGYLPRFYIIPNYKSLVYYDFITKKAMCITPTIDLSGQIFTKLQPVRVYEDNGVVHLKNGENYELWDLENIFIKELLFHKNAESVLLYYYPIAIVSVPIKDSKDEEKFLKYFGLNKKYNF